MTMHEYHFGDFSVFIGKQGLDHYEKLSCPIRYGNYTEIHSGSFVFQFDLNAEIKHIQSKNGTAMDPMDWLKRTVANDWVYYSSGGYNGAFDAVGEYYVPCFTYPSNSLFGGNPFKQGILDVARASLQKILKKIAGIGSPVQNPELQHFFDSLSRNDPQALNARAEAFHRMIGGAVSVLPPDARHVDYDVIPLTISDGCIYNCRFCTIKTGKGFSVRSKGDIDEQIRNLQNFYGRDIRNFNSVFLGQHDALHAGMDMIEDAAEKAYHSFDFALSNIKGPRLFLFGSADSLLLSPDRLFRTLSLSPYETTINIGLESVDEATLKCLGKPLSPEKVTEAFERMIHINRSFPGVEITANFLYGDGFADSHLESVLDLIQRKCPRHYPKGAVYLSPYGKIRDRRALVSGFKVIKNRCTLPMFMYIIQRL
ncbi:MAG: radical SAM protein [Proteobacteria bacterium]|nr:radical SAM protein [Pseudomonadota bacterium]